MPETFGSGVAPPTQTFRVAPAQLGYADIAAHSGSNVTAAQQGVIVVIQSLDIVSDGGGSGGALFAWHEADGQWYAVFNIGSSADVFSWRGALVLNNRTFGFDNQSDTRCQVTTCGLLYPVS